MFDARNLWQWQRDGDLAGIRDTTALAKLPPEERTSFAQFWADVAKLAEVANAPSRVEFARVAALIATEPGKDEPPFDDAAKAKLRQQALDWLKVALTATADRAGKAQIVAAAAPLPGVLEKLAESAPRTTDRSGTSWPAQYAATRQYTNWRNAYQYTNARCSKPNWRRNRRTPSSPGNWPTCC